MNNQEKSMIWSSKLKVHRANLQTMSSYPVRFSADILFSALVSSAFCLLVFLCFYFELKNVYSDTHSTMRAGEYRSTGASDRSFYPIFNKRFDHLETLLTICRPQKIFSAGSLCGPLVPSPQFKYPKKNFMLPQKYHVSVPNMLSKSLKCFM